jgi:hypothetical protein
MKTDRVTGVQIRSYDDGRPGLGRITVEVDGYAYVLSVVLPDGQETDFLGLWHGIDQRVHQGHWIGLETWCIGVDRVAMAVHCPSRPPLADEHVTRLATGSLSDALAGVDNGWWNRIALLVAAPNYRNPDLAQLCLPAVDRSIVRHASFPSELRLLPFLVSEGGDESLIADDGAAVVTEIAEVWEEADPDHPVVTHD